MNVSYIIIIFVLIVVAIIMLYNNIIKLNNNVKKSKSLIDVYLQQRFDLIPNLIEITKGYMNYEKEVLERITQLRTEYEKNKGMKVINELNRKYNDMIAVVENYPELKAGEQFLKLQKSLVKIESQLQAARRIYNNDVTKYNTKISVFPNNILANTLGFGELELFVLDGERELEIKF